MPVTGGGWMSIGRLLLRFPILIFVVGVLFIFGVFSKSQVYDEALVTINFDDGYLSTYTIARPIMEKYGITGLVYVVPQNLQLGTLDGFMDVEMLRSLVKQGWRVGSHSMSHAHLPSLDSEELQTEIGGSRKWLDDQGFDVNSFASPYGEWNETTIAVITRFYGTHRTAWPRALNELDGQDPVMLHTVFVEEDVDPVVTAEEWIDKAIKEKKWLILSFHRINESGQYNVSAEEFETIMAYLSATDVVTSKSSETFINVRDVVLGIVLLFFLGLLFVGWRNRRRRRN